MNSAVATVAAVVTVIFGVGLRGLSGPNAPIVLGTNIRKLYCLANSMTLCTPSIFTLKCTQTSSSFKLCFFSALSLPISLFVTLTFLSASPPVCLLALILHFTARTDLDMFHGISVCYTRYKCMRVQSLTYREREGEIARER